MAFVSHINRISMKISFPGYVFCIPYQGHDVAHGQTLCPKYKQITFRICSQTNGIFLNAFLSLQVIRFSKPIVKIIQLLVSDDLQLHVRRKCGLMLKAAALVCPDINDRPDYNF